jgi:hypothetical protein
MNTSTKKWDFKLGNLTGILNISATDVWANNMTTNSQVVKNQWASPLDSWGNQTTVTIGSADTDYYCPNGAQQIGVRVGTITSYGTELERIYCAWP